MQLNCTELRDCDMQYFYFLKYIEIFLCGSNFEKCGYFYQLNNRFILCIQALDTYRCRYTYTCLCAYTYMHTVGFSIALLTWLFTWSGMDWEKGFRLSHCNCLFVYFYFYLLQFFFYAFWSNATCCMKIHYIVWLSLQMVFF